MTSNIVATPPDITSTMSLDPTTISLATSIPDIPTIAAISFASLPREIRDKIYEFALLQENELQVDILYYPFSKLGIVPPKASTCMYASEACAIYFARNRFKVLNITDLKTLLSDDGVADVIPGDGRSVEIVPKGHFDVKIWIRSIVIRVPMGAGSLDQLCVIRGLLSRCPALKEVKIALEHDRFMLTTFWRDVVSVLGPLDKRVGLNLTLSLVVWFRHGKSSEKIFIGNLMDLKKTTFDDRSNRVNDEY